MQPVDLGLFVSLETIPDRYGKVVLITGQNCFTDNYLSWPPPQKQQLPKSSPWNHRINSLKEFCKAQTKPALSAHTHTPHRTQSSFFTAEPVSQGNDATWQDSAVLCCSYSGHTMGYLQRAAACLLSIHSQTSFERNRSEQESSRQLLFCKENNPKNQWPLLLSLLIFRWMAHQHCGGLP